MKLFYKLSTVALALLFVFTLQACDSNNETDSDEIIIETTARETTISDPEVVTAFSEPAAVEMAASLGSLGFKLPTGSTSSVLVSSVKPQGANATVQTLVMTPLLTSSGSATNALYVTIKGGGESYIAEVKKGRTWSQTDAKGNKIVFQFDSNFDFQSSTFQSSGTPGRVTAAKNTIYNTYFSKNRKFLDNLEVPGAPAGTKAKDLFRAVEAAGKTGEMQIVLSNHLVPVQLGFFPLPGLLIGGAIIGVTTGIIVAVTAS